MNADLTFNTIVFKKSFDEKDGSRRRSTARGVNTPDDLIIKRQGYTDASTQVAGNRHTGRVDRYDIDANNDIIVTSLYFVAAIPETAAQASIDNVVATFKAVVADASFITAVLNGET